MTEFIHVAVGVGAMLAQNQTRIAHFTVQRKRLAEVSEISNLFSDLM